jgi:hypothetical protein
MEKKSLGRGLEDISDAFLSSSEGRKEKEMTHGFSSVEVNRGGYSHQAEDHCEIEETVTVRKKIAFQNDENVQQNIRKALSEHLEEGFSIRRIELKKNENFSETRSRVRRDEEVTIFVKASPST